MTTRDEHLASLRADLDLERSLREAAERERDEAREQLKANHECALILEKMVYQARQERDEARDLHAKAIEERRSTECEVDAMLERALTAERERDEAREIATELAQCLTVAKREGFDPRLMEVCEAVLGRWEAAK